MSFHAPHATTSASSFLHLAPPSPAELTPDEIRALVLEYLVSSCCADSAQAFAREVEENRLETTGVREDGGEGRGGKGGKGRKASVGSVMSGMEPASAEVFVNGVFDPDGDEVMQDEGEDETDELEDEREVEEGLRTNGTGSKTVAFEEEEDERAWPMLGLKELCELKLRRDIRDHILAGRIQHAFDLLNEHFPSVLADLPALPPSRPSSKSCDPKTFFVPTTSTPPPSLPRPILPILGATFSPSSLSLSPSILSLNLQLQSFVELIRTANSTSRPSTPTPLTPSAAGDSPPDTTSLSASTSSFMSSRTGSMMKAIAQSQALGKKVQEMPAGRDKESWQKECVDVSGLLAYVDLSICPVRGYLAQERREGLAELVNAAVLQWTGGTPMPLLGLAARQAAGVWGTLAEFKVGFPPAAPGATKESGKSKSRTYPRFSLREFLSESAGESGGR